jgi:hypothetical protein
MKYTEITNPDGTVIVQKEKGHMVVLSRADKKRRREWGRLLDGAPLFGDAVATASGSAKKRRRKEKRLAAWTRERIELAQDKIYGIAFRGQTHRRKKTDVQPPQLREAAMEILGKLNELQKLVTSGVPQIIVTDLARVTRMNPTGFVSTLKGLKKGALISMSDDACRILFKEADRAIKIANESNQKPCDMWADHLKRLAAQEQEARASRPSGLRVATALVSISGSGERLLRTLRQ